MSHHLQVFVSSTCHDLRDLRAVVRDWFKDRKITAHLSDEIGFPNHDGMSPYASCLRVLDRCPLVVGVIDRRYGAALSNWTPYDQHKGLAATHAELRHALDGGKRVLLFIQRDIMVHYETFRKNNVAFDDPKHRPPGIDSKTFEMVAEFKLREPAPWICEFDSVTDICDALNDEFINQLYEYLLEREDRRADAVGHLLRAIKEAGPAAQEAVTRALTADAVKARDASQKEVERLEAELAKAKNASNRQAISLHGGSAPHLIPLNLKLDQAAKRLDELNLGLMAFKDPKVGTLVLQPTSGLTISPAAGLSVEMGRVGTASSDPAWLSFASNILSLTTSAPLPLQNSQELGKRGYVIAGNRKAPRLTKVTWRPLNKSEGGLWRGFEAGLILEGEDFVPGVTWTQRRRGSTAEHQSSTSVWQQPRVFFDDHLEVPSSPDSIESPLSHKDSEFQLRNPEGLTSDWVTFSHDFVIPDLERRLAEFESSAAKREAEGLLAEADELRRKAWMFSDRLYGVDDARTKAALAERERVRESLALSRLRFRVGAALTVTSGPETGRTGIVQRLRLNHRQAYVVEGSDGANFQVADDEVAPSAKATEGE